MLAAEHIVMFAITGLSNLFCFPCLYIVYKRKMVFCFINGLFTFLCSFMYHSMESLNIKTFYLTCTDWHKLDNIGSIMSLVYLMVFLMDNLEYSHGLYLSEYENKVDRIILYLALFITLFMQTDHP